MLISLLALAVLLAAAYPLAAALQLSWRPRLLTALALGLTGGPALAWTFGVLLPVVRPDLPLLLLGLVGAVFLVRDLRQSPPQSLKLDRAALPVLAAMLIVAVVQCSVVSGTRWEQGRLVMANMFPHDMLWHLSIAAMLRPAEGFALPWPPPNPVWSDARLVNYHPLTDVLVALLAPHDAHVAVYAQVLPPLYSLLFAGSTAWVARRWGASYGEAAVTVLLVGVCGSFGHLVALLNEGQPASWDSAFWLSQPWTMCNNPPLALSYGALMVGLALLSTPQARRAPLVGALAILWGLSFGVKAYLPALVIPSLAVALLAAPRAERRWLTLSLVAAAAGAGAMLLLTTRGAAGMLLYDPAWLAFKMLFQTDRLGGLLKRTIAPLAPENRPPVVFAWFAAALPLYVVGNLGLRATGLRSALRIVRGKEEVPDGTVTAQRVAFGVTVLGLLMPLLFKQRGVEWNTVQFGYYPLALSSLWAGPRLLRWIRGSGTTWKVALRTFVVLLLALPTTIQLLAVGAHSGSEISASEVTALWELGKQVPVGAPILVDPGPDPRTGPCSTAYVAALTGRPTYYADWLTLEILLLPGPERVAEVQHGLKLPEPERQRWLDDRGIRAVYTPPADAGGTR